MPHVAADRTVIADQVRSAREALTEDLGGLRAEQWDVPSLCAGWTVRDVVAHLVLLDRYECVPTVWVAGVLRAGFRPNRFMAQDAKRLAERLSPDALVAALCGSKPEQRWIWLHHPAPDMLLGEFVLHGMDVRRPLAMPDRDPAPGSRRSRTSWCGPSRE